MVVFVPLPRDYFLCSLDRRYRGYLLLLVNPLCPDMIFFNKKMFFYRFSGIVEIALTILHQFSKKNRLLSMHLNRT